MGVVFRQSVKATIVVFSGSLFGALLIWMSTKYIPDKQQFGFLRNLMVEAIVLAQILQLGLQSTMAVYIHNYEYDHAKKRTFLTILLLSPIVLTGIATILYYLFKVQVINHFKPQDIPYIRKFFGWLPVYTLLFIYQLLLEQYLVSQMKVAVSAFIKEVPVRALNIALIILFSIGYLNFTQLVAGTVLINLLPVILYFIFSMRTDGFGFSLNTRVFSKKEYMEMAHYSWYHALLLTSLSLLAQLDILMLPLNDRKGLSAVAVYAVAVYVISFLQLAARAMTSATLPPLAQAFRDKDHEKARNIFTRSSINIFIATVGMAILIVCNLHNLVLVINRGYDEILPVTLILMIGRVIDQSTGMNDQVLSITNYYKFNFYLSCALVAVMYFLTRALIHRYGIYGAAWSSSIVYLLYNVAKFIFVWKKLDMQPFSKGTLLVLVACMPALAAGYYLPFILNPFVDAAVRTAIVAAIYSGMLLLFKPSPDLSAYLASVKKNKRLF